MENNETYSTTDCLSALKGIVGSLPKYSEWTLFGDSEFGFSLVVRNDYLSVNSLVDSVRKGVQNNRKSRIERYPGGVEMKVCPGLVVSILSKEEHEVPNGE